MFDSPCTDGRRYASARARKRRLTPGRTCRDRVGGRHLSLVPAPQGGTPKISNSAAGACGCADRSAVPLLIAAFNSARLEIRMEKERHREEGKTEEEYKPETNCHELMFLERREPGSPSPLDE